jgi:hypothetical protein
MQYVATVHFNTNHDHWFGFDAAHARDLVRVPVWPAVHGDTPEEAAEQVFAVANKMTADDEGAEWPAFVRSLSVGDVIVLGGEENPATPGMAFIYVLTVESFGFKTIAYADFAAPDQPNEVCWDRLVATGNAACTPAEWEVKGA